MKHTLHMLEISQPIGSFYVGKISSTELVKISKTVRRHENVGIQRELSGKRVKEIAKYCEDPDATFPTPIILSIKEHDILSVYESDFGNGIYTMEFDDKTKFAEILDGQHRVEGIKLANKYVFELMIVVMFDLTEEEKAYIFSTINSTQTKVDRSLIYELFELSESRSPYKTCHEIARVMNSDPVSPFYKKLKMLGKKGNETEVLSQGTFVSYLVKHISKNPQQDMIDIKKGKILQDDPNFILRKFFINDKDDIILKLMYNYFGAVKFVFEDEWYDSKSVISKTTGYGVLIKLFKDLYKKGLNEKRLTLDFFIEEFESIKSYLKLRDMRWTSYFIKSGEQGQRDLYKELKKIID